MVNIHHGSNGKFIKSGIEPVYIGHEKEYKHQWYLKNKERLDKKSKERYQKNKAQYNLLAKIYQSEHKEKTLEYKRTNKDNFRFDGKRKVILERDNFQCQLCYSKDKLVIHHIDGSTNRKKGSKANNNPLNLITLCRACHIRVHRSKVKI